MHATDPSLTNSLRMFSCWSVIINSLLFDIILMANTNKNIAGDIVAAICLTVPKYARTFLYLYKTHQKLPKIKPYKHKAVSICCFCVQKLNTMSVDCTVRFVGNPCKIYYPGQTMNGTVELNLPKIKKVKAFYIKIFGIAQVSWSEQRTRDNNGKTETYHVYFKGYQEYMNSTMYLIGDNSSTIIFSNAHEIPMGIHTYNFVYVLPTTIPGSFEGVCGSIRYSAEVCLDRPWKFDQKHTETFQIMKQLDLNTMPTLKIPSELEKIKTFCCWPCTSDPLIVTAVTPMTGYASGQIVKVTLSVNNTSRVTINHVIIKVVKTIHYRSQTPEVKTKTIDDDVVQKCCQGVPSGGKVIFKEELLLPAVEPTDVASELIQTKYEIQFHVVVNGCHNNVTIAIPVTMGTTPFDFNPPVLMNSSSPSMNISNNSSAPPMECTAFGGSAPSVNLVSPGGTAPYPPTANMSFGPQPQNMADMPPPSYEECQKGDYKTEQTKYPHNIGFVLHRPN